MTSALQSLTIKALMGIGATRIKNPQDIDGIYVYLTREEREKPIFIKASVVEEIERSYKPWGMVQGNDFIFLHKDQVEERKMWYLMEKYYNVLNLTPRQLPS